jgi:hypothetical protein
MEASEVDVSVIRAKAMSTEGLSSDWKFAFTTGYGHWALSTGRNAKNPVVTMVPWEIAIEVRHGNSYSCHLLIGNTDSLKAPTDVYNALFGDAGGDFKFLVWTKKQTLFLSDKQDTWRIEEFCWQEPLTYFCALSAIYNSGFYSNTQMLVLFSAFDPEWAEKGCMIDDQSFFDAWLGKKEHKVYNGYWKYFVMRLSAFLRARGLLYVKNPNFTLTTELSVAGNVSAADKKKVFSQMPPFFSEGLQVGLFGNASRLDLGEFHQNLPAALRNWIEKHREL